MNKARNVICLAFVLLLAGCVGRGSPATPVRETEPAPTASASPMVTPTPVRPSSPTPELTPTATLPPTATHTPAATHTPVIPPEARLEYKCLEMRSGSSGDWHSTGRLVLETQSRDRDIFSTILLDMKTGEADQISPSDEVHVGHRMSPNRKLLAYHSYHADVGSALIISSADGQPLKTLPWEEGWYVIAGWLDDEHLVIDIGGLDPEESESRKAATLLVLNPFTGERRILRPNYPEILAEYPVPNWDGWSVTMYDPLLTRVAYLRVTEEGRYTLALWDLQKQELLASLDPYLLGLPRWSPDGSRLVVGTPIKGRTVQVNELFLMDRDGQIEQLTNLNAYDTSFLSIHSWSPDGRYIAAYQSEGPPPEESEAEFVIVDTDNRQVTNYCLRIKYRDETLWDFPIEPVWSPDGKLVIINDWLDKDHSRTILVDLEQGFAMPIAEDFEPMGWMISP